MKELLENYSAYNVWANQKLTEKIGSLSPELQTKEMVSSFPSLHKTLLHMWDAETVWWQRIRLVEQPVFPSVQFSGDTSELMQALNAQSKQWQQWIQHASMAALHHVILYHNVKREPVKMQVGQIAQHVMNHGTYHRGQLVTMLRMLNIEKLPQTDYSLWVQKFRK
ncbi:MULTISPECIES: DinB family protein [unclassified Paraflavitalea]|uniref:DinB family protein n=1 Tax=unclassified Paraflavitalea TaxID=2798305 RepID=UPI003D358EAD